RAEREPAAVERRGLGPAARHLGDLLEAARALPPLGTDDVRLQRPVLQGAAVDGCHLLPAAEAAAGPRVLPSGDAEREELVLRTEEARVREVGTDLRAHVVEQSARALVEGARRSAVGFTLDATVGRVGG